MEEKHDVFDFWTKNQHDLVHILGEKTKSSPTRKFIALRILTVWQIRAMGRMLAAREGSNGLLGVSWTCVSSPDQAKWPISKGIYHNR